MRNTLLILHIIGVAIWLGGNIVLAFVGPRVGTAEASTRVWWAETQGAMARVLYNVAGILVLVTGVAMVLDSDFVKFSSAFISIGFLAVIVGAVLGMAVFGPGSRKLAAAIREGDTDTERAVTARLTAFGVLDSIVVVITIVAMVGKWGL
jgi:uncharacterized membrane protein